jgi:ABC-2 type transport system permease protein
VLAILGGNFVPLSRTPELLDKIALSTPNGWAVRAFADLSVASGDPLRTVAPALVALLGFAVLAGAPVALLANRIVRSAGV